MGQAYCRRQRVSHKPSFLIHLASTAKVSDFCGLNCAKSRSNFYDAETLLLFGFATCALATLASRPTRLTRQGYNAKVLAELLNAKSREINSFLSGQLAPGRTHKLHGELPDSGNPASAIRINVVQPGCNRSVLK